jgi:hypothetical protein
MATPVKVQEEEIVQSPGEGGVQEGLLPVSICGVTVIVATIIPLAKICLVELPRVSMD